MFTLKQEINKASGGGRLVLVSIFVLTVAFSSDLGAWCTDYYQGLSARNQLLDCNDNIVSRQYRVEKQSEESDVVKTKDGHVFIIFTGGHHKFDKGTDKIYDKSNNIGFLVGYEKSCNENLTLGAFAGYSNTDYKQDGICTEIYGTNSSDDMEIIDDGNVRSGIFGVFGRYLSEKFSISGILSGSLLHYDSNEKNDADNWVQSSNRNGYSICGTGDIRYKLYKNEKLVFGPLVALTYCYVEQDAYSLFLNNNATVANFYAVKSQFGKTLIGEAGLYGTYDCSANTIPVRVYGSLTFSGVMKKPDSDSVYYTRKNGLSNQRCVMHCTHEPSSYINVRLGVTSAVSESIDLNADVKASFANDYYGIMGAVGMSYGF